MKTLLKRSTFLFATCIAANLALPAVADSTADLLLNLKCQGGYNIEIWKTRKSDELLYRSTGAIGMDEVQSPGLRGSWEENQMYLT